MNPRLPLCLALLAVLAACNQKSAQPKNQSASGEVLDGTISDAMLPYDKLTSHPPLAGPEETEGSDRQPPATAPQVETPVSSAPDETSETLEAPAPTLANEE